MLRSALELERQFADIVDVVETNGGILGVELVVLEMIARPFGCQWATYWEVNASEMRLRPAALWRGTDIAAVDLTQHTYSRKLSLSEGTAGHVWRSRKPIWTTNLVRDMCLPRSLEAKNAGLHGGLWFALKTDTAVYGVIKILGRHLYAPSEEMLVSVEQFGIRIGRCMEVAHLRAIDRSDLVNERS